MRVIREEDSEFKLAGSQAFRLQHLAEEPLISIVVRVTFCDTGYTSLALKGKEQQFVIHAQHCAEKTLHNSILILPLAGAYI